MNPGKNTRAQWLKIGLGVFAAGMAIGTALFVYGRSGNADQAREGEAEGTPGQGQVPQERHKNIATVAAR